MPNAIIGRFVGTDRCPSRKGGTHCSRPHHISGLHHELIIQFPQCHTSVVGEADGGTGWTGAGSRSGMRATYWRLKEPLVGHST